MSHVSVSFYSALTMDLLVMIDSISITCVLLASLIRAVESCHSFSEYRVYRRVNLVMSMSLCVTLAILVSLRWSNTGVQWTPVLCDLAAVFPSAQIVGWETIYHRDSRLSVTTASSLLPTVSPHHFLSALYMRCTAATGHSLCSARCVLGLGQNHRCSHRHLCCPPASLSSTLSSLR